MDTLLVVYKPAAGKVVNLSPTCSLTSEWLNINIILVWKLGDKLTKIIDTNQTNHLITNE